MQKLAETKKEILKNTIALLFSKKNGLRNTSKETPLNLDYVEIESSLGKLFSNTFKQVSSDVVDSDWFHAIDFEEDTFYIELSELKDLFVLIDQASKDDDLEKIIDGLLGRFDFQANDFFERVQINVDELYPTTDQKYSFANGQTPLQKMIADKEKMLTVYNQNRNEIKKRLISILCFIF